MLQIETISDAYSFHSYDDHSARLIKPNRNIHSSDSTEDDFITLDSTCLVFKDTLSQSAFPAEFKLFDEQCIESLQQYDADIFLIGTGKTTRFPEKKILQQIRQNKLAIDFMDNGAACRTFNILTSEYRKVAALIFFE